MDAQAGNAPALAGAASWRWTRRPARAVARLLMANGLLPVEAGNLIAFLHGLQPVDQGWTGDEIERLLFLRYLLDQHRLGS